MEENDIYEKGYFDLTKLFSPEELKELTEGANQAMRAMEQMFTSMATAMPTGQELKRIRQRLQQDLKRREQIERDFKRQFRAMKQYLKGQNLILPAGVTEFLYWFLYVRGGNDYVICPNDFLLFHEYKEKLFKYGGRFLAEVPDDEAHVGPEPPTFEQLFKSVELANLAYQLAVDVGMIHENGLWSEKWRVGAIVIYWEYLAELSPVIVSQVGKKAAIDAICRRFDQNISERTGGRVPKYRDRLRLALKAAKNFPF